MFLFTTVVKVMILGSGLIKNTLLRLVISYSHSKDHFKYMVNRVRSR